MEPLAISGKISRSVKYYFIWPEWMLSRNMYDASTGLFSCPISARSSSTRGPSRRSKPCWRMQQLWMWNAPRKTPTKKKMEKNVGRSCGRKMISWIYPPGCVLVENPPRFFLRVWNPKFLNPSSACNWTGDGGPSWERFVFFLVDFERPKQHAALWSTCFSLRFGCGVSRLWSLLKFWNMLVLLPHLEDAIMANESL